MDHAKANPGRGVFVLAACGVAVGAFLVALLARAQPGPVAPQSGEYPEGYRGFLATAAAREARYRAESALTVELALKGIEAGAAGIHLLRPVTDPHWNLESSIQAWGDHSWWPTSTRYANVEYQRRFAVEIDPYPNHGVCDVSQARLLSNRHGTASMAQQVDGSYSVMWTVDQRGLDAIQLMLSPIEVHADGSYVDWFNLPKNAAEPPTEMRGVLVGDKQAYLPFSISTLAQASAPAHVNLASGLTQGEAQGLVTRLQQ